MIKDSRSTESSGRCSRCSRTFDLQNPASGECTECHAPICRSCSDIGRTQCTEHSRKPKTASRESVRCEICGQEIMPLERRFKCKHLDCDSVFCRNCSEARDLCMNHERALCQLCGGTFQRQYLSKSCGQDSCQAVLCPRCSSLPQPLCKEHIQIPDFALNRRTCKDLEKECLQRLNTFGVFFKTLRSPEDLKDTSVSALLTDQSSDTAFWNSIDTEPYLSIRSEFPENIRLQMSLYFGKNKRGEVYIHFLSHLNQLASPGFDRDFISKDEVLSVMNDRVADQGASFRCIAIAAPLGFEDSIRSWIEGNDSHLGFRNHEFGLLLVDLRANTLIYDRRDRRVDSIAQYFLPKSLEEYEQTVNREVEDTLLTTPSISMGLLSRNTGLPIEIVEWACKRLAQSDKCRVLSVLNEKVISRTKL